METSARTLIAASIEDVYEYVSSLGPGAWPPDTVAMELVGGEPGVVGTMYRRVVYDGTRDVIYRHALVEALPEQILTFHSESEDFRHEATYHYEFQAGDDDQTWLVVLAVTPLRGLSRFWARIVPFPAQRRTRSHLEWLRRAIELSVIEDQTL